MKKQLQSNALVIVIQVVIVGVVVGVVWVGLLVVVVCLLALFQSMIFKIRVNEYKYKIKWIFFLVVVVFLAID